MTAVTARAPPAQDHYQAPCEPSEPSPTSLCLGKYPGESHRSLSSPPPSSPPSPAPPAETSSSAVVAVHAVSALSADPPAECLRLPGTFIVAEAAHVQGNGGKKGLNGQLGCIGSGLYLLSTDKDHHCISLAIALPLPGTGERAKVDR